MTRFTLFTVAHHINTERDEVHSTSKSDQHGTTKSIQSITRKSAATTTGKYSIEKKSILQTILSPIN